MIMIRTGRTVQTLMNTGFYGVLLNSSTVDIEKVLNFFTFLLKKSMSL